ncbi:MAG: DUF3168 domain-containing protein [Planctomycetaceae bacterium]|nr:DUF3168 domain-containing protein [Planctomycetota bacterium]NUN51227.1 DUF3168 domain-containing protein [Planctomycetaceae bacterium]
MTLGAYLRMVLTQDPGVAALAADRVYSEVLPQAPTPPAVVFDVVSADEDISLSGPTGVRRVSVVVDSWARKRADATALGLAVRRVLAGHSGAAGGLEVQAAFLVSERWAYDAEVDLYRTTQDFEVWTSGEEAP